MKAYKSTSYRLVRKDTRGRGGIAAGNTPPIDKRVTVPEEKGERKMNFEEIGITSYSNWRRSKMGRFILSVLMSATGVTREQSRG